MDRFNTFLQDAVLEIVQTQIEEDLPLETKTTYTRLIKEGFTEAESKKMIGCILMSVISETMKKGEAFDLKTYRQRLSRLPKYPYEGDILQSESKKSP